MDIGMDVHKEATAVAVLNASGKSLMESIVETKAATIVHCAVCARAAWGVARDL
jgi:hypothetical protein